MDRLSQNSLHSLILTVCRNLLSLMSICTSQRYASVLYAVVLCLSVRLSVRPVLYQMAKRDSCFLMPKTSVKFE